MIGAAAFVSGMYFANAAPEVEVGFTVQDIAIVNLDESVEYLDEVRNFGAELMVGIDSRYQLTGLFDARNGLESGRFAAYIVIPANFSQHVISINSQTPLETLFSFEISRYLEEQTRLLTLSHIMDFQRIYQERLSSMYLMSILTTFHEGQDSVTTVLNNDAVNLETILNFDPNSLVFPIVIEDLREFENTLVHLDTTEYRRTTFQMTRNITEAAEEFMLLSELQLSEFLIAFSEANDYFWLSTIVDEPIPMLEELERFQVELEISEYLLEIQELNEGLIGINEINLEEATELLDEILEHLLESPEVDFDVVLPFAEIQLFLAAGVTKVEGIREREEALYEQLSIIGESHEIIFELAEKKKGAQEEIYETGQFISEAYEVIQDTNIVLGNVEELNYLYSSIEGYMIRILLNNPTKSFSELKPRFENSFTLNVWLRELFLILGYSEDVLDCTCELICIADPACDCETEDSDCPLLCDNEQSCECTSLLLRYLSHSGGVQSLSAVIDEQAQGIEQLTYYLAIQNNLIEKQSGEAYLLKNAADVQRDAIENAEKYFDEIRALIDELEPLLATVVSELETILSDLEIEAKELLEEFSEELAWILERAEAMDLETTEISYLDEDIITESVVSQVDEQVDAEMIDIENKLEILREEQEEFIEHIIESHREGQEVLAEYVSAISGHSLMDTIDEDRLNVYHLELDENLQELDQFVSENMDEFVDFAYVVMSESDETIGGIRTEVSSSLSETQISLDAEMEIMRTQRQVDHLENSGLLNDLANTLPHSRVGSFVNQGLINTLIRPVDVRGNHDLRATVSIVTNTDWMIPSVVGMVTLSGSLLLLGAVTKGDRTDD